MIYIDYIQSQDAFRAMIDTSDMNYFEKDTIINQFKFVNLYFNYRDNTTTFTNSRILELIEWCRQWSISVDYSGEAIEMLERKKDEWYPREIRKHRPEEFNKEILNPGRTPKNFQWDCLNWGIQLNRQFIMDDPGLGKSYEGIAIASHHYSKGRVDSIFLVVKPGLTYHWQHEILESVNLFTADDIKKITNENKYDIFADAHDKKIIIISNHVLAKTFAWYSERIRKDPKNKNGIKKTSGIRWGQFCDFSKHWGKTSTYLIIDESHEFKNPKAEKSKALAAHLFNFKYRMLLSATPFINDFIYAWFQFFIIDPSIIRTSFEAFTVWISKRIGSKYSAYDVQAYDTQKVESVIIKSQPYIMKRVKSQLPEMVTKQNIKPLYFEMSASQEILYQMMFEQELWKAQEETGQDFFAYKDLSANFPYTIQCIDNVALLKDKIENKEMNKIINRWKLDNDPRIEWLDEHLKEVISERKEKVVIFDTHPLTIDMLVDRYPEYKPQRIHGQTKQTEEERQAVINAFNDLNNPCKLIVLSAFTSSAGINLQYGGNDMVVFTNPFDTLAFRQLIDRQHRINSTRDSQVWICVIDRTFDNTRAKRNFSRSELNDTLYTDKYNSTKIKQLFFGLEKKEK